MQKAYLAATIAALTTAFELTIDGPAKDEGIPDFGIVYPDGETDSVRIDPNEFPAVFKWPKAGPRCGATMVAPRVALTASHCVSAGENTNPDLNMQIELTDGNNNYTTYDIVDIRANECWFSGQSPAGMNRYSADVAILILDRDITPGGGAPEEGKHYLKPWETTADGSVEGEKFILAGWGQSGEVNIEYDDSD